MRTLHAIRAGFLLTLLALLAVAAPIEAVAARSLARTWHVAVGVASADQAIQGMAFLPGQIWVDVGDTVIWTIQSGEFHTVTFLARGQARPPFNPTDPRQTTPQGGSHYDGRSYANSGLLIPGTPNTSYHLTFDVAGDYTYVCLIHSMMKGIVHVRPRGTRYPYTQAQYDQQARQEAGKYVRHGAALMRKGQAMAGPGQFTAGIGDGTVAVQRFLPPTITIHVGETVTWVNRDIETPHTVTFGQEPPGGPAALVAPYGNPSAYNGTRPLNSGYVGVAPPWLGPTFRVRFTKAGTYHYICGLHDDLGMKGTVIVLPALGPGPGAPAELPNTGLSDGRGELGWLLVLGICCGLTGAMIRRTGLLHR